MPSEYVGSAFVLHAATNPQSKQTPKPSNRWTWPFLQGTPFTNVAIHHSLTAVNTMDQFTSLLSTPAASIGPSPRSADWCDRYIRGGLAGIQLDYGDYSEPQYQTDGSTIRIFPRPGVNGHFDTIPMVVPWKAGAVPSAGTDHQMDVGGPKGWVSPWGFVGPGMNDAGSWANRIQGWLYNLFRGFNINTDAIAWECALAPAGSTGNTHLYGPGGAMYASTVTADEVAAGKITHAMNLTVPATISMNGPVAPASITDVNDPAIGTTYGAAASPARFVENPSPLHDLANQVPHATRVHINITDAEIAAWVVSQNYAGATATTARIFAVAMRDYGLVQNQTGNIFASPLDGSPAAVAKWKQLGLIPTLLKGLITRDRLEVLRAPMSTDVKGNRFTREGEAVSISY